MGPLILTCVIQFSQLSVLFHISIFTALYHLMPIISHFYYDRHLTRLQDMHCSHVFLFPNQEWVLKSNEYLLFISMYLLARHRMACCFVFLILNESINISIYHFSWLSLTRRDFRILPVEQRWIFRETLGQLGPISFPQMLFWLRIQVLDSAAMRKDTRSSRIRFRFKIHTFWVSPVLLKNSIAYHFNPGIAVMPEIKVHNSLWRKLLIIHWQLLVSKWSEHPWSFTHSFSKYWLTTVSWKTLQI